MARQQRAARWMALAVALLTVLAVSAAVLVSARQGISAFMSRGG